MSQGGEFRGRFRGHQAFVLKEEQYPELAQLNQELQEYLRNITIAVNEKIDYIQSLEIYQSLLDQLHEGYSEVSQRLCDLELKLPKEVKQAQELVVGVSLSVVEKSLGALRSLKRKVTPATDKVTKTLYSIVVPYTKAVLEKVDAYTGALRQALATGAGELNPKLKEKLAELRSQLAPYAEELRRKLQEFQASLKPFTYRAHEKFRQGVKSTSQLLQPYFDPILQALQKYSEGFKKWMDTPQPSPAPQ
ncbi:Apolipoprotein A-IV [Varanus komodoensis]|nr:Apolipoprotein A-IV [Varanus komodoensis]